MSQPGSLGVGGAGARTRGTGWSEEGLLWPARSRPGASVYLTGTWRRCGGDGGIFWRSPSEALPGAVGLVAPRTEIRHDISSPSQLHYCLALESNTAQA